MRWTWFATFTTPYELTLPSARRLVERTVKEWRKIDASAKVFWVAEKFELKDGYHLHALVYAKDGEKRFNEFVHTYQAMARGRVVGNVNGKDVRAVDKRLASTVTQENYDDGNYSHVNAGLKPAWCRIQLSKFDKRRAAAEYLVPYMFKENRGQGADFDFLL